MTQTTTATQRTPPEQITRQVRAWCRELGFDGVGFAHTRLEKYEARLMEWLGDGMHGEMHYMAAHGDKRSRPAQLVEGTVSVISVRMNYLTDAADPWRVLEQSRLGYVSHYALGRDYHKLMRKRLQALATRMERAFGPFGYRAFVDSAPVLEKPLAEQAGLGWIGKHTNLIDRASGSWFFLGELYTTLPLPPSTPQSDHCGRCRRCLDICPTQAIVAPYRLDARRCISYLTIELKGSIPVELRPLMGNRIYGCDDCQLVCPWNRFARLSGESDFRPRRGLDGAALLELFAWDERQFRRKLAGSPIRRIGHERWQRNIAVALGNNDYSRDIAAALEKKRDDPSALVREHVRWALNEMERKRRARRSAAPLAVAARQPPR